MPQSLSTVVGSVQNLVGGQAGKMVEFATDALEPAAATLEQQQGGVGVATLLLPTVRRSKH